MPSITIITTSDDRSGSYIDPTLNTTDVSLSAGNFSSLDRPGGSWIPFIINLPRRTIINSATLQLVCTGWNGDPNINIGIYERLNTMPVSGADLESCTFLQYYNRTLKMYAGTSYTWDFTTAVQGLVNYASWVAGSTIAALLKDNNSPVDNSASFASFENPTYAKPQLIIDYTIPGVQFQIVGVFGL